MLKSKLDVVQWGTDRLRIGPWRGDARTAYIAPVAGRPAAVETIEHCVEILEHKGYVSALTAALTVAEQQPFLVCGFTVHERLHLLRHDLTGIPTAIRFRLRRALPFDQPRVLDLDARAFDVFWRFDREGLGDARRATPSSRFRVADERGVVGYAITGRSGPLGYLQRLAVDPGHHQRGIGTALVLDGLWWAKRRGAATMLVNTQETNYSALALYERLGFVGEEQGLAVLERPLQDRL
jgi:ribosomal protein S18 acetylase RimI-like enzyme